MSERRRPRNSLSCWRRSVMMDDGSLSYNKRAISCWSTALVFSLTIQAARCWVSDRSQLCHGSSQLIAYIHPGSISSRVRSDLRPLSSLYPHRHPQRLGIRNDKLSRRISIRDLLNPTEPQSPGQVRGSGTLSENQKPGTLLIEEVKSIEGVDVFIKLEGLGGNRRRISGGLFIEAPPEAIWGVLTNYSSLNEYIPNIAESGSQLQPNGKIRIEQVGVISQTLNIRTRIVLEVTEEPFRKLTFSKIESREFLEFEGTYSILEFPDGRAYLEYSVDALPLPILPIFLVQSKIQQEVPPMLAAVRKCANRCYQQQLREAVGRRAQGERAAGATAAYTAAAAAAAPPPSSARPATTLTAHSLPAAARSAEGGWASAWLGSHPHRSGRPAAGGGGSSTNGSGGSDLPGGGRLRPSSLPFASMASSVLEAAISLRKFLPGMKPLPGDRQE